MMEKLLNPWYLWGFLAQTVFASRFLYQWLRSERAGESIIPIAFWYLSIVGSSMLLVYAIHQRDPVFILGQTTGSIIYIRNLILIHRKRSEVTAS